MFSLKPREVLERRLEEVFEREEEEVDREMKQLEKELGEIIEAYPEGVVTKGMRFKLEVMSRLRNNSFGLKSKEEEFSNNCLLLLEGL